MKHLVFGAGAPMNPARFEERSLLPVSAACVVANAMRERLSSLTRCEIDLRLWPPAIPQAQAWDVILHEASVYVVRGTLCDAAIVLRAKDAHALAALLFGEQSTWSADGVLSPLETEITRRAVSALSSALSAVCGETALARSAGGIDALTYFELHVLEPVACCLGVALSREPQASTGARIDAACIGRAGVTLSVEMPLLDVLAARVAALQPGDVLPAATRAASLCANGTRFARADCGVIGERFAARFAGRG